jgi:hypothetical protein
MTRRFEIKLPEERLSALEAVAHEIGVSTAALAKVWLTERLENRAAKQSAERQAEAA